MDVLFIVNTYPVIKIKVKECNYMCTPISSIYKQLLVIVLYIATKLYICF
jgi:hypothetical protein